jgi:hypothetical protein
MISKTFFNTLGKLDKPGKDLPPPRLRAHNPNLRNLRGASPSKPPKVTRSDGFLSSRIPNFFRPSDLKSFRSNPPRLQGTAPRPHVTPNISSHEGVSHCHGSTAPTGLSFSDSSAPLRENFTTFCPKLITPREPKVKSPAARINPIADNHHTLPRANCTFKIFYFYDLKVQ